MLLDVDLVLRGVEDNFHVFNCIYNKIYDQAKICEFSMLLQADTGLFCREHNDPF